MRRILLAAVMFGAASGAAGGRPVGSPDSAWRLHRRADAASSVNWQGYLCRRPGRLRLDRHEACRRDSTADLQSTYFRSPSSASPTIGAAGDRRTALKHRLSAASSATTRNGTTSSSASRRTIIHGGFRATRRLDRANYLSPPICSPIASPIRARSMSDLRFRLAAPARPAMSWGASCPMRLSASAFGSQTSSNAAFRQSAGIRCFDGRRRRCRRQDANWSTAIPPALGVDVHAGRRALPARRIRISARDVGYRNQHQHRARWSRLQILIVAAAIARRLDVDRFAAGLLHCCRQRRAAA